MNDKLDGILRRLRDARNVVIDTETSGLSWKENKLVGWVFTFGDSPADSFYVPVRHRSGNIDKPELFELNLAKAFANNPSIHVVGHHLKFDLHFMANCGVLPSGTVEDTMVNAALIDEEGQFSLEACCRAMGVQEKKGGVLYAHIARTLGGVADRKIMGRFWEMPGDDPVVVDYATGDGTSTWQLWRKQLEEIDRQELQRVHALEKKVTKTLFRMERNGVRVDVKYYEQMYDNLNSEVKRLIEEFPPGFNPRSPVEVRKLVEAGGHSDFPRTQLGNPSFPESYLETIPVGQKIVFLRKMSNISNSFIRPLLDRHVFSGRVHTTFNQAKQDEYGVVTGRLSSTDPNEQQIPKRDKVLAPMFRKGHLPEKDHVWVSNDFKQQEFVVFAHYANAQAIVEGYKREPPVDIHQTVANLLGVERDPTAKRIGLGKLYGMGIPKLADSLGVSIDKAAEYSRKYDAMIPEARHFLRFCEARAKERGWVKTIMGRRRHFQNSAFAHKAGNSVIQGTSADITKQKMVEVDDYFQSEGDDHKLLLQVHDSLEWSAPPNSKVTKEAQRIMTAFGPDDVINLRVPLRLDSKEGKDWAGATFGGDK